jgi:Fic family protein
MKITELKTRDEQEVGGYYDVLNLVLDNFQNIELTESHILSLHNLLMKHSHKDERHRGNYKQLTNQVVATYPDGTQRTVFRTTEVHLVQKEMSELLAWTQSALAGDEHHRLIVIGAFIYGFLSIHPFQDGNGRLSRLLSTLLLLQNGYHFVQFVSFENLIESRKADYYRALMDGQKDRYVEQERMDQWLFFFLDCLGELANRLDKKYEQILKRGGYLSARRQEILDFSTSKGNVQIADVLAKFPDVPRSTLKADLAYLVREYYLQKTGVGRGTVYAVRGG